MKHPSLRRSPITDSERNKYADHPEETDEHVWGKRAIDQSCSNNSEAEITIEQYLGTCRPDVLIEAPIPSTDRSNHHINTRSQNWPIKSTAVQSDQAGFTIQGRAVEIVAKSAQRFLERTLNALRCGYVIYWVFIDDDKAATGHEKLDSYLTESVTFGRFDPYTGDLSLGDAISFANFDFRVKSLKEFDHAKLKGKGWTLHNGGPIQFNVGEFLFDGDRRRVYCSGHGRRFHSFPPGEVQTPSRLGEGKYRLVDVHHLVKDGLVKRVGPTAGYRPNRYADSRMVSNAYLAPKKVKLTCHTVHQM